MFIQIDTQQQEDEHLTIFLVPAENILSLRYGNHDRNEKTNRSIEKVQKAL